MFVRLTQVGDIYRIQSSLHLDRGSHYEVVRRPISVTETNQNICRICVMLRVKTAKQLNVKIMCSLVNLCNGL